MNMEIRVHGIKTRKHMINLSLNMWKANKQQTCETKAQKKKKNTYIYIKGFKIESLHVKKETELEKLGLGFLGRIMRMHEQAYVHRQDYAYVGSTQKP